MRTLLIVSSIGHSSCDAPILELFRRLPMPARGNSPSVRDTRARGRRGTLRSRQDLSKPLRAWVKAVRAGAAAGRLQRSRSARDPTVPPAARTGIRGCRRCPVLISAAAVIPGDSGMSLPSTAMTCWSRAMVTGKTRFCMRWVPPRPLVRRGVGRGGQRLLDVGLRHRVMGDTDHLPRQHAIASEGKGVDLHHHRRAFVHKADVAVGHVHLRVPAASLPATMRMISSPMDTTCPGPITASAVTVPEMGAVMDMWSSAARALARRSPASSIPPLHVGEALDIVGHEAVEQADAFAFQHLHGGPHFLQLALPGPGD